MALNIWVVTHGERFYGPEYPNPGMTDKGKADIRALKKYLPPVDIITVVCGTGIRFIQIAEELDLTPNRFTTVIGTADAITKDKTGIVLADGTLIPKEQFTTRKDMGDAPLKLIQELTDRLMRICWSRPSMGKVGDAAQMIICGGRPFMGNLGINDAQEGQLYLIATDIRCRDDFAYYKVLEIFGPNEEDRRLCGQFSLETGKELSHTEIA